MSQNWSTADLPSRLGARPPAIGAQTQGWLTRLPRHPYPPVLMTVPSRHEPTWWDPTAAGEGCDHQDDQEREQLSTGIRRKGRRGALWTEWWIDGVGFVLKS